MRPPAFWWRPHRTLPAKLLRAPAFIYGAITARRMRQPGARAARPVICVGNFTVGGSGKTPAALAIAAMLAAEGEQPSFLSRGYGGRLAGPIRVDPAAHGPEDVGDEPLLLARAFPTVVSHNRVAGARLCAETGASVIVMDDGLQNPSLVKDLAMAVIDGAAGVGNGLCLPAGPLRAPLERQWPHVDAVLLVGTGAASAALADEAECKGKQVLKSRLEPDRETATRLRGRRVFAFAGIGRPEKLFVTLRDCGATLVRTKSFPDHHPFDVGEIRSILAEARAEDLIVVTTEKDYVRLGTLADVGSASPDIQVVPVRLVFEDESAVRRLLLESLRSADVQRG